MRKNKNEREQSIFQKYMTAQQLQTVTLSTVEKDLEKLTVLWKGYEGAFTAIQEQFEEHLEERLKQATAQKIIKLEKLHEQQPEQLE